MSGSFKRFAMRCHCDRQHFHSAPIKSFKASLGIVVIVSGSRSQRQSQISPGIIIIICQIHMIHFCLHNFKQEDNSTSISKFHLSISFFIAFFQLLWWIFSLCPKRKRFQKKRWVEKSGKDGCISANCAARYQGLTPYWNAINSNLRRSRFLSIRKLGWVKNLWTSEIFQWKCSDPFWCQNTHGCFVSENRDSYICEKQKVTDLWESVLGQPSKMCRKIPFARFMQLNWCPIF